MTGTDFNSNDNEHVTATATEERTAAQAAAAADAAAAAASAIGDGATAEAVATAEKLAAAEAEAARLKGEYLRALAETENVRKRAARDRQEASQFAIAGLARDLLSVADNLQRALASVDAGARSQDPALAALMNGVEMTEKELLAVLDRHGVKPIAPAGQLFDPHVHEALFEIPDPSVPHGTILQVVQPGYLLHERTLRPARVGIARGGPKPGEQPAPAEREAPAGGEPAESDTVIEFPQAGGAGAYRKPDDAGGAAGSRVDETT